MDIHQQVNVVYIHNGILCGHKNEILSFSEKMDETRDQDVNILQSQTNVTYFFYVKSILTVPIHTQTEHKNRMGN